MTDASQASARPRKRRRGRDHILTEDDVETADAIILHSVMQETAQGPMEEISEIPVWTNRPGPIPAGTNRSGLQTNPPDVPQVEEGSQPPGMPEFEEFQEDAGGQAKTKVSNMITHVRFTVTE